MKIEILRSVMIKGEPAQAGSFLEVDQTTASLLIGMGKACVATEPAPAPAPEVEAPKRSRKPTAPAPTEEE